MPHGDNDGEGLTAARPVGSPKQVADTEPRGAPANSIMSLVIIAPLTMAGFVVTLTPGVLSSVVACVPALWLDTAGQVLAKAQKAPCEARVRTPAVEHHRSSSDAGLSAEAPNRAPSPVAPRGRFLQRSGLHSRLEGQ